MILDLFKFGVISLCEIMPTDSNTNPIWLNLWDLPKSTDYVNVNVTYLPNEVIITFTEKFIKGLGNEIRQKKKTKIGDL